METCGRSHFQHQASSWPPEDLSNGSTFAATGAKFWAGRSTNPMRFPFLGRTRIVSRTKPSAAGPIPERLPPMGQSPMNRDTEQDDIPRNVHRRWFTHYGFWQALAVTAIGTAFAIVGLFMVIDKGNLEAWSVFAFFAAVAATGVWQLFDHLPYKPGRLNRDPASGAPAGVGTRRTLQVGQGRWTLLAMVCAAFMFGGYAMLQDGQAFAGWGLLICFGIGLAISLVQLTWWRSALVLEADRFHLSNLGRSWSERWDECSEFTVILMHGNNFVGYDRAADQGKRLAAINRSLAGAQAMLPDTFGFTAENLVELLNAYRAAAIEQSWQRHERCVAECKQIILAGYEKTEQEVELMDFQELYNLPEGVQPWPSFLIVTPEVRDVEKSRRVLICVDVLSPYSRWFSLEEKQNQASNLLGAEELQIISPESKSVRRFVTEPSSFAVNPDVPPAEKNASLDRS